MASAAPVLEIDDLDVVLHRDGVAAQVLHRVSLSLDAGEILALVGESGSGKSTLGLAIQGLLPADAQPGVSGRIAVDGTDVVSSNEAARRRLRRDHLGAVFQDPMSSLNPTMRVGQQLREATATDEPVARWLDRVGLPDPQRAARAFPHQLSGGQRQRVMIAMAMANRPSLVIADEPTTALDVTVQARILDLIHDLRDESGTAFIFVTHDLAVAASVADRVAVLYRGRVVEEGTMGAVLRRPAHPYTAALLAARFDLTADRQRRLATLPAGSEGTVEGACAFEPRCVLAVSRCREGEPEPMPVPQHDGSAACIRALDVTSAVWEAQRAPWSPTSASPDVIIEVSDVDHVYRSRGGRWSGRTSVVHALRGVQLAVADGESVALVGESGSGKSTLLRVLAGLITPSTGQVQRRHARTPQMVFQDAGASLTPWLTVGDLVGERLRGSSSRAARLARTREVLGQVGLPPGVIVARPTQLSGGQQQRVAIARAIVLPPELLLCDEPVSAMDVSLAASILNLLGELRRELQMTMVFVTHDLAAARYVADRIVVMQEGQVVEEGMAEQVVTEPEHAYTRELLGSVPVLAAGSAAS